MLGDTKIDIEKSKREHQPENNNKPIKDGDKSAWENDATAIDLGQSTQDKLDRLAVRKTYKLYIGGKFPRTESGRYYCLQDTEGTNYANICLASRKDFREGVVVARNAFTKWRDYSAYLRSQILYRIAEMLEGRRTQFEEELVIQGMSAKQAAQEVFMAVDRLVYYAGWCDKYQQIFSSVNPVASSHFNFTVPEPTGVVAITAPQDSPLLGFISVMAPCIAGGNTAVILANYKRPLCAVSLAEVLHSSDLPGGVVNILTGLRSEILPHMASHMDVNALVYCGSDLDLAEMKSIHEMACENMKRVIVHNAIDWQAKDQVETPYWILNAQEKKTTWHPIARVSGDGSSY